MRDLADIVEDFKLNIDRISPERLVEVFQMIGIELNKKIPSDIVPKTRLNEILDEISHEDPIVGEEISVIIAKQSKGGIEGVKWALARVRREIDHASM